ncbi:MAG: hypothetical protein GY909_02280 [Oligoflexia bacterium]|nr:hypothetical protein [Oligoflexia bacterium]
MKISKLFLTLLATGTMFFSAANADEQGLILIPETGDGEVLLVKSEDARDLELESNENNTEELNEDADLLQGDYTSGLKYHGQFSGTVMALEVRAGVGVSALRDRLEVGVDAAGMLIMAGDGAGVGSVGAYAKVYVLPKTHGRYYVKGRAYKAWGFSSDLEDIQMEYGIGFERESGDFFELTLKDFQFEDGDRFIMPFFSAGIRLGKKKDEELVDLD